MISLMMLYPSSSHLLQQIKLLGPLGWLFEETNMGGVLTVVLLDDISE